MSNQSDLAKELDLLHDTLTFIDNFTDLYNVDLDSYRKDDNSRLSSYIIAFKGLIYSLVITFSFISNLLVLIALVASHNIQQSSCIFFSSMALADLGVTVLGKIRFIHEFTFKVYLWLKYNGVGLI